LKPEEEAGRFPKSEFKALKALPKPPKPPELEVSAVLAVPFER